MTGHRDDEEAELMAAEREQQVLLAADREQDHDAGNRQRLRQQHPFVRQQRPRLEHQHPGQQIQRQRQHPKQGGGRDIGRDMRRHRDQQAGRHRSQEDPARPPRPGRRQRIGIITLRVARGRISWRPQQQHAAACDQNDQQAIAAGPDQVLGAQREHRLEQHRIGQQRQEAADVRGCIEKIWIRAVGVTGAHEPGLQQRVVGGEREERQADRDREQAEQPDRVARGWRLAPAAPDRERQCQQRDDEQHEMHHDRHHAAVQLHQQMCVGVAAEQQGLEEHHRHRPHRRRAAEPRQHHLG
ncbi:hypothetical protein ACVWW1_003685 [Bradyrhizobium sp. JR3.5]